MNEKWVVLLAGALLLSQAAASRAAPLGEWVVYAGSFNASKSPRVLEIGGELRFATRWPKLAAVLGAAGTEDGAVWIYGGARYGIELGSGWAFGPGFAISFYEDGDGKDLGGAVEFRSSLELCRRIGRRLRLGLIVYHLSNAGLFEPNPGSNSAVFAWSYAPSRN